MIQGLFKPGKISAICLAAVLFCGGSQAADTFNGASGPIIFCAEPTLDFGMVEPGSTIRHAFILENRGDQPLLIKKIHAPCGCTTFKLHTKEILPGESLALPVELDLRGRKGPQNRGVYVESNASNQKVTTLALRGEVGTGLELRPPIPILRTGRANHLPGAILEIRSPDKSPLSMGEILEAPPGLQITLREQAHPGTLKLDLQWATQPPIGQHTHNVVLLTSHPKHPEARFTVLTIVQEETTIHPEKIILGNKEGGIADHSILIRPPEGTKLRILEVEVPDAGISWSATELASGLLQLNLTGIDSAKNLRGKSIRVHVVGNTPQILLIPFE